VHTATRQFSAPDTSCLCYSVQIQSNKIELIQYEQVIQTSDTYTCAVEATL